MKRFDQPLAKCYKSGFPPSAARRIVGCRVVLARSGSEGVACAGGRVPVLSELRESPPFTGETLSLTLVDVIPFWFTALRVRAEWCVVFS